MQTIDFLLLIVAAILIGFGIKRGLIGEIIRLIALVGGCIVAFLYYHDLSPFLKFIPVPRYIRDALSFVLIYIAVALAVIAIGWAIKKIVHLTPLGWIDRILGGAIGLLKAAIIAWVICLSIAAWPGSSKNLAIKRSFVYRAYRLLPKTLSFSSLEKARNSFRSFVEKDALQKIGKAQDQISEFKNRVDSVKQTAQEKF